MVTIYLDTDMLVVVASVSVLDVLIWVFASKGRITLEEQDGQSYLRERQKAS